MKMSNTMLGIRMEYRDHQEIHLGDIIEINMPQGRERAKVVMLGENYKHLPLEPSFVSWVKEEQILAIDSIVIEWIGKNPHDDPNYAPVGNYMFTGISADLNLIERNGHE